MAPSTKPKGSAPKKSSSGGRISSKERKSSRTSSKTPSIPTSQHKTKRPDQPLKKKRRKYTEKELGISALNSIVPAGVQKPKGVKKGKVFLDDQASMLALLNIVQAEKEGDIESKMMRARQMEEIRAAKREEQEKRAASKKESFENVKMGIKGEEKRSKSSARKSHDKSVSKSSDGKGSRKPSTRKKSVCFG